MWRMSKRKADDSRWIVIVAPADVRAAAEAHRARLQAAHPGLTISLSDAVRDAILRAS